MKNNQITYERLCSADNLDWAHRRARKGKTLKPYVIEFEKNLKENLLQLRTELIMQTYQPKPLETFILRDPKTRKISKADFRDRVIHHAICNIIEPDIDKTFISDSYANRLGKGSLNAIKRFELFSKKVSKNNTTACYVLKADIKHYFKTVKHKILLDILRRNINDENIIWLINIVLENHQTDKIGEGMPLGNLTSQFFANIYLNELDQYIKHELKAKHYIRYVDDFVIFSHNKEELEKYRQQIDIFLKRNLSLELHPEKTRIMNIKQGIPFLGIKIFPNHRALLSRNKRKFQNKLKQLKKQYNEKKINREQVIECFQGWLTYASNADSYKYRRQITSKFNQQFPAEKENQITTVKKHENFNQQIEQANVEFSKQKTLRLLKNGLSVKEISVNRELKESTIWQHTAKLIELHQIQLKNIVPSKKVKIILKNIKTPDDTLKEIKTRINNNITYDEINCVLANIKSKHLKKRLNYHLNWHQKTNCKRKCYYNKQKREECRLKMQQLNNYCPDLEFTKKEFLDFFNKQTKIGTLEEKERKRFVSWQEFRKVRKKPQKVA
ncbi:MAG: reverse transcriptase domain-containing protein [Candidatus Nanoarchaeia archaeon]